MSEQKGQGATAKTFAEKVNYVMRAVGNVPKSSHNKEQNYDFTRAADVQERVRNAMCEVGLFVGETDYDIAHVDATKGGSLRLTVKCTVRVTDGMGGMLIGRGLGGGADGGDKAGNKSSTSGYKYALLAAFCGGMKEDPEADESIDREEQESVRNPDMPGLVREMRGVSSVADMEQFFDDFGSVVKTLSQDEKKELWEEAKKRIKLIQRDESFTIQDFRKLVQEVEYGPGWEEKMKAETATEAT